MTALEVSIWIKLCVWLAIGYTIYFFYGIRNSSARDDYVPVKKHDEIKLQDTANDELLAEWMMKNKLNKFCRLIQ